MFERLSRIRLFSAFFRTGTRGLASLLGLLLLGACAYSGAPDHPAGWKFTWYSYLNGGDLRQICADSRQRRYRLVYNGIYQEQRRAYDLVESPSGGDLTIRVFGDANLSEITLDPSAPDLFSPWRPSLSTTTLRPADLALLDRALLSDGAFSPAPDGLRLAADQFFWTVVTCRGGAISFNAFLWRDDGLFDSLAFPKVLRNWDFSEIQWNPPRKTTDLELYGGADNAKIYRAFTLTVGQNGLRGQ